MIINWIILSFQLVVFYESYITVEGAVVYPLAIAGIRFDCTPLTNDWVEFSPEHRITISKAENRFIVNIDPLPNVANPLRQRAGNNVRVRAFPFVISEIFSIAGKIIAGIGSTPIFQHNAFVFMNFNSMTDAKNFFSTELYHLITAYNSLSNVLPGVTAQNNIHCELSDVLVHVGTSDERIKRISYRAILDSMWLNHPTTPNFRSFHVHAANTGLESSDIMFTTAKFNVYFVGSAPERVVVGIWIRQNIVAHVCLIFARHQDATDFINKSVLQVNPALVPIKIPAATRLLEANLGEIEGIMP